MKYERLTNLNNIQEIASDLPPKTVIIPGGDRIEDLQVAKTILGCSFVKRCILVGDIDNINKAAAEVGIEMPDGDIIGTDSQEETAATTISLVKSGEADVVLKGNISTPVLNREMLKIKTRDTISLATIFQAPSLCQGRPVILTDAGFTTVCNIGRLTGIIENSAEVARSVMGIERPKVALLSANEKVIPSLKSTSLEKFMSKLEWQDMDVTGPLSFDLATDPNSVRIKGIKDEKEVAGNADILVCPGLDSANILYKVLMSMTEHGLATTAGVTLGVQIPYIILSRADSEEAKINSVALCCIFAERRESVVQEEAPAVDTDGEIYKILTVNPGSTSTKVALFENMNCIDSYEIEKKHTSGLKGEDFDNEVATYCEDLSDFMNKNGNELDAVVGRGGFLNREHTHVSCGTFQVATMENGEVVVDKNIVSAVTEKAEMDHASNLGIPIAAMLAKKYNVPAFSVDPVVSDEFCPEARVSGYKGIERKSTAHALSVKRMASKAAAAIGHPLDKLNLVVVHMGGGITAAAIREGKMIDNNIALLGGHPFTPARVGNLPMKEMIDLCYSGKFTKDELKVEMSKKGGLTSLLGTHDMQEIVTRIESGDEEAKIVVDAMAYQIAKEVGSMYVAAGNHVEAIVFSGGLAKCKYFMSLLKKRVGHLAQVIVFYDNVEFEAMTQGALEVLVGKRKPIQYK